jgi:hypothetical protein
MLGSLVRWTLRRDPVIAQEYYSGELRRTVRRYGPDSAQALAFRQEHAVALYRSGQREAAEAEFAALIARSRAMVRGPR